MSADKNAKKDGGEPAAAAAPKKPMALIAGMLVAGLALGGGGATAYFTMMAKPAVEGAQAAHEDAAAETEEAGGEDAAPDEFVEMDRFIVPMVNVEGTLIGYATVKMTFQTAAEDAAVVKDQLPMIQHQINILVSTTQVGLEKNPRIMDVPKAAALFAKAANLALEKPLVKAVQIVSATAA